LSCSQDIILVWYIARGADAQNFVKEAEAEEMDYEL
jgi:hypothetical protein